MFPDLFKACLNGSSQACEKIYFFYWVSPRLEKLLRKLSGGIGIAPLLPPRPGPDPPPVIDAGFLRERAVVQTVLGSPNPQPNIISREVRLRTSIAMRDALTKMVESLTTDIEHLEPERPKK